MREVGKLAAMVVASILVALLLAEGLLRAVGYHQPQLYEPHRQLGWILRAGVEDWYTDEGHALVRVNSVGMRDREHAVTKPAGVYRIAILGDSYSEAKQVPIDSTYWSFLPGNLARCGFQPGKRVEVLNFSVAGYGTAQELLLLRLVAARYGPDLVLLQFTGSNDIRNNSRALEPGQSRPFFVLEDDGTLRLDDSFASRPGFRRLHSPLWRGYRRLAPHSRVLQLARAVLRGTSGQRLEANFAIAEAGLDEAELSPPTDPRWAEAWRMTEALIAEVSREAARHQAEMLVLGVPWPAQLLPDPKARQAFAARAGVPDLSYPDRRLQAFGRAQGIPVLTLAPAMGEAARASATFLNGFGRHLGIGHWNPAGHRVAAEVIAEALCAGMPRAATGGAVGTAR